MGIDKLGVVRKLLAKAAGAATPEEAESYTAKAVELMARHGIDAALAAAAEPGQDEIGTSRLAIHDPYSAGKARLLAWTASALRCRAVLHQAYGGRVAAVSVLGFTSDRERVELLFTSLLLQSAGPLTLLRPPRAGESVAAYRRAWLHGFAVAVHQRLVAAEAGAAEAAGAGAAAGSGSVALVLADRAARVDRAYADAFPGTGRARPMSLSGSGFGAGTRAGAAADLGGRPVGHGPWAALRG